MGVIPCGHRVVVKQIELEEVDDTFALAKNIPGFKIAGTEHKREQEGVDVGTVVAIGPTAFNDFGGEAWCTVGDIVAFVKYSGKSVVDFTDKQRYQVFNDADIVCVLKKGE